MKNDPISDKRTARRTITLAPYINAYLENLHKATGAPVSYYIAKALDEKYGVVARYWTNKEQINNE